MAGAGSTQPSITCVLIKSPGSEWSGAIVVREFRVGRWKRGRSRKVRVWGERRIWRGGGDEEQADVNGLLATWDQGSVWAWAMTKGHVLI